MPRWSKIVVIVAIIVAILIAAGVGFAHSRYAQGRIEALARRQIRQASGLDVVFGSFHLSYRPLRVVVTNVVVHGREATFPRAGSAAGHGANSVPARPAAFPPLATIARVEVGVRIRSLLPFAVALTAIRAAQPRVHIYKLPDGGWNLPRPPEVVLPPAEPIFDLGLRRLEVSQGVVWLQDRRLPLALRWTGAHVSLVRRGGDYTGEVSYSAGEMTAPIRVLGPQSADLRFTLWPNDVRVDALRWSGPGAALDASGQIHDLAQPRVWMRYAASANLADWRTLTPPWLAGGQVHSRGEATWSAAAGWSAGGDFRAADLRLRLGARGRAPGRLIAGPLAAGGQYRADARGLVVPAVRFTGLGGSGSAQARLTNWRRLRVTARVRNVELEKILRFARAGSPGMSVGVPPLAGRVTARLQASLTLGDPRSLAISGDVTVAPPSASADPAAAATFDPPPDPPADPPADPLPRRAAKAAAGRNTSAPAPGAPASRASGPAPGQLSAPLPLAGAFHFSYRRGHWTVTIPQLGVRAPNLNLSVAGSASPSANGLRVSLRIPDLSRWAAQLRPYLPPLPGGPAAPPLSGSADIQAVLRGPLDRPTISADVSLAHFAYGRLQADQITARATIAPDRATVTSLRWTRGDQTLTAAGSVALVNYHVPRAAALGFHVVGRDLNLAQLLALADERWPARGRLDLDLNFAGTVAQPSARGAVALSEGRIGGQPVASARAEIQWAGSRLQADPLRLEVFGAAVAGHAAVDWRARTFQLALSAQNVELRRVAALQSPQLAVSGVLDFALNGDGPWAHPRGSVRAQAVGLRGGGESLGDLEAALTADGVRARFQATDILPNGQLAVTGTIQENAPYDVSALAQLSDYDVDALLRRFTRARVTGHSVIGGQVRAQGSLAHPSDFAAQANFDPVHLSVEGFALVNSGPVRVALAHQVLSVSQAHFTGPDTDLSFSGSAQLRKAGALAGAVNGRVNLALIHAFYPTAHSSGELTLAARLAGTWTQPRVNGDLRIADASLAEENLPVAFDHIQGDLRFTGDRVDIDHLSAQTGGGIISLTGFAARSPGGFTVNLDAAGNGLRARYQGVSATSDLRLRLNGNQNSLLLSGQVTLQRVAVASNFDVAVFLANRGAVAPGTVNDQFLDRVHLDVRLVTGPQVEVATSAARLQISADLRARGTLAKPVLLGRASIAEGSIRFAGNQYTISKGEITFANPARIAPILDFGLSTTVQQYDITLNVSGPADKLNITYRSDPPLSSRDIVALLATGQTRESQVLNQQSTSAFAGQGEQILGLAFDNLINSRVEQLFGVTQIQVNPTGAGLLGTGQATVTIEQQVSRNLRLVYTQNLSYSTQQIIQVEWTINRHLAISLSRDDEFGLYGLVFHFRHRAR